jgi:Skp family chaperone for outer membrane proteins
MDDSADKGSDGKGLGDGENAENKSVKSEAAEGATPEHKLPVVWSPKLDAGDDIEQDIVDVSFGPSDEPPPYEEIPVGEAAPDSAATASAAPASRSSRFVLLAACVSVAAAIGSFAATLTEVGISHVNTASVSVPEPSTNTADANSLAKALKAQLAELNAMKSSLDSATHYANAQLNSISDRLEKVEHAQTDPAQLAHIADSVDRLTRLNTSTPETTGSITPPAPGATAAAPPPAEPKITDRILQDWVLEDVHGDRALVASRYGGEFLVMPGSVLPGAGHVDAVKRQDGQWVVVTARGLIMEGR